MSEIECGCVTCKWCEKTSDKYGKCTNEKVTLKFRAAIDFPGKGTVIYLECLELDYGM